MGKTPHCRWATLRVDWADQAKVAHLEHGLEACPDAEVVADLLKVVLDRAVRDAEDVPYICGTFALLDPGEDFQLTRGNVELEKAPWFGRRVRRRLVMRYGEKNS